MAEMAVFPLGAKSMLPRADLTVETVATGQYPGLRLIPYRTIGQSAGFLAAMRMENVKIGKWQGSRLVAFAPAGLDAEETYQALTGGIT